jgi:hypothetical protein
MTTDMTTEKLQDFAASVMMRRRLTFGDVRRLQRDYLPGGITTREDAEMLIALSDRLMRADKAWAQWLVVALARYLRSQQGSEPSIQDAARVGVETLLAASPAATALGRRIARAIRRELPKLMASEIGNAPQHRASEAQPVQAEPCPTPASQLIRAIARSEIITQPSCTRVARRKRKTPLSPVLPVEVWSARMMEKHQRFQLGRPYF